MVERRRPRWIDNHGGKIRIRMRVKGKTYSEVVEGDYYNPRDLRAAERRAAEIHSRLSLGIGLAPDDPQKTRTLFGDDCQAYIDQLDVKLSTGMDYANALNRHWLPVFSRRFTNEITEREIKRVLSKMDCSNKRKKNVLIPLRGVFDLAEVKPNPADIKVKTRKKEQRKVKRFTPQQRQALMEVIDDLGDYQQSAYFALLLGCGLRPSGEPLGLKWTDYDGEYIHVHRTIVRREIKPTTKTDEDRRVYVPTWVRKYINRLPSRMKGGWLFLNSQGGPYRDSDTFNALWKRVFETKHIKHDKKMEYQIPYVCRHSKAAELLSMGIEPARAAKQLGHSVQMFLTNYSEYIDEYSGLKDDTDLDGNLKVTV